MSESRIKYGDIVKIFGVTKPMNDAKINAIRTNKVTTDKLTCQGDIYLNGTILSTLNVTQPMLYEDGNVNQPSISFKSDKTLGLYKTNTDSLAVVKNGGELIKFDEANITANVPITTSSGDLMLSAAGPNIDFGGKNLYNYGSLITNPNRFDMVSTEVITTDATPTLLLSIPLDIAAYLGDLSIVGNTGVSTLTFSSAITIKNPSGTPTVTTTKYVLYKDPSLSNAHIFWSSSANVANLMVVGVASVTIKWRAGITLTRQTY